jgi:hypothetical protein
MEGIRFLLARRVLAAGAVAIGVSVIGAGGALADPVSKPYTIPTGDVPFTVGGMASCTSNAATPTNIGQVCFTVTGVSGTVDLTIQDASPLPVGGSYVFYKPGVLGVLEPDPRNYQASGVICGSARGIAIPDGAKYLFVMVGVVNEDNNFPFTQSSSIACGQPSPGTKGTVSANFSDPGAAVTLASSYRSPAPAGGGDAYAAPSRADTGVFKSRFRLL